MTKVTRRNLARTGLAQMGLAQAGALGLAGALAAPALAQSVQVERAVPREKPSDGMSFLRWFFVAWGGVLTFASAVRMAVG